MKLHQIHTGTFVTLADETEEHTYLKIVAPDGTSGWYLWAPDGWVMPNLAFSHLEALFQQMNKENQNG